VRRNSDRSDSQLCEYGRTSVDMSALGLVIFDLGGHKQTMVDVRNAVFKTAGVAGSP
jgi:hypothetical protein